MSKLLTSVSKSLKISLVELDVMTNSALELLTFAEIG